MFQDIFIKIDYYFILFLFIQLYINFCNKTSLNKFD